MSNSLIAHGGGIPEGYNVRNIPTRLALENPLRRYWAVTNTSDMGIYLALYTTAEVGKGIYLAPNGGAFELNNVNMYFGEIWAIIDSADSALAKHVTVQKGQ